MQLDIVYVLSVIFYIYLNKYFSFTFIKYLGNHFYFNELINANIPSRQPSISSDVSLLLTFNLNDFPSSNLASAITPRAGIYRQIRIFRHSNE